MGSDLDKAAPRKAYLNGLTRDETVIAVKHDSPVVMMISVEEYQTLKNSEFDAENNDAHVSRAIHQIKIRKS